jgi:hypothetical protein
MEGPEGPSIPTSLSQIIDFRSQGMKHQTSLRNKIVANHSQPRMATPPASIPLIIRLPCHPILNLTQQHPTLLFLHENSTSTFKTKE